MNIVPVLVGFAVAIGAVTGGMAIVDEVFTPTYDLSAAELDDLHDTASSGKRGLQGFTQSIQYPTGDKPYDVTIGFPSSIAYYYPDEPSVRVSHRNDTKLTAPPVQLGEAFLSAESYGGYSSYTPTVDEHGSYVTSVQKTPESSYATMATMVLANPNADMFGDDGQASTEEMEAFYNSDQTRLVSFNSLGEVGKSYDDEKETCEVVLTVEGKELKTDAQDDCAAGLEVDDDESFSRLFADRFLD